MTKTKTDECLYEENPSGVCIGCVQKQLKRERQEALKDVLKIIHENIDTCVFKLNECIRHNLTIKPRSQLDKLEFFIVNFEGRLDELKILKGQMNWLERQIKEGEKWRSE